MINAHELILIWAEVRNVAAIVSVLIRIGDESMTER